MTTELVPHQTTDLASDMRYAEVISGGAMLPTQYRGKPADILIAMGLGRAMGLSPAESLYRIHVIQGRPTASAELIAANVRKAGHILRVKGDEQSARAVIIRSDDPEFEFESTWDLERAKRLGLSGKDGWQKQPGTMMRWRAITEVARLACPEALYGVAYVAEELADAPRTDLAPPATATAADFLTPTADSLARGLEQSATGETVDLGDFTQYAADDVQDAEVVADEPKLTARQRGAMFAEFTRAGIADAEQLPGIAHLIGRTPAHRDAITADEYRTVMDALKGRPSVEAAS